MSSAGGGGCGNAKDREEESHCYCRRQKKKQVICLFGLSGDPPTGDGGHVGIVRALLRLRRRNGTVKDAGDDDDDDNDNNKNDGTGAANGRSSTNNFSDSSISNPAAGSSTTLPLSSCHCYVFDQVWVLPVYRHTFQEKQSRLVSFEHRMRMCELAFADLDLDLHDTAQEADDDDQDYGNADGTASAIYSHPSRILNEGNSGEFNAQNRRMLSRRVVVSDAERKSWEAAVQRARAQGNEDVDPSRVAVGTASLLEYLREVHPHVDFHFCLGEDSFLDLACGKWKESDRVLELLRNRLLVVHRSSSRRTIVCSEDDGNIKGIADGSSSCLLTLHRAIQSAGARLLPVPGATAVSSSQVRASCRNNLDDWKQMQSQVPAPVLQYMREHRLRDGGTEQWTIAGPFATRGSVWTKQWRADGDGAVREAFIAMGASLRGYHHGDKQQSLPPFQDFSPTHSLLSSARHDTLSK